MLLGAFRRSFCRLAFGVCLAAVLVSNATADELPATQPSSHEAEIRALIPALKERESGIEAIKKLATIPDPAVKLLFTRIQQKAVYEYQGKILFAPAERSDPKLGKVYDTFDVLVPAGPDGKPTGAPVGTVASSVLGKNEFAIKSFVRRQMIDAMKLLDLPLLREQALKDPDPEARRVAAEKANLLVINEPSFSVAERVKAASELGELKSIASLDSLKELANEVKPSAADSKTVEAAITKVNNHVTFTNWISNLFFGLSLGSIYVLLALGLAITFGLMGVINMAHGEMMMIGAVTTWACCEFIAPHLPAGYFDWYYVIAFPLAFLTSATVGLVIELSIVRFLYKRPLDSLLATIGVSYVLIQAVRLWKGDNLGMQTPSWAGNHFVLMQDVILPYNRLFLIVLTIFCILSVICLFRFTSLGLMIRATVQNREMARALGVNTRMVDMVTFALGAGLAGLAGYGIVLTGSNPSPEMGQTFIVKSFLTVVIGGVGKLAGVIVAGLGLGFIEKILEPIVLIKHPLQIFDSTWAQVAALLIVIGFMQRKPAGLFPDKGRMADQADKISAPLTAKVGMRGDLILGGILAFIGFVVVPMLYGAGKMTPEFVNTLGYISTFAVCAIGLDLIWGYIGVLSLCQFMFFSMGAYCMGIYLINHGPFTADGIPACLSIVMSAVTNRTPPWFLPLFRPFPIAVLLGILLPGILALLIGVTTFRSRVRGVYFSILTQAITVMAVLIFQKNDLKLGGTNGLGSFDTILGHHIASNPSVGPFQQTRFWLYIASVTVLLIAIIIAKLLVNSGFGRVLVAIRDDETRLRFVGYQTWAYKAVAFTIAGVFAAIGGMLYVPQLGSITPGQMLPFQSILVVAWVAIGGRGSLWGAVIGTFFVSLLYNFTTSIAAEYWYFILGGLFIIVPLVLPGGIMSVPTVIRKLTSAPASPQRGFEVVQKSPAVTEGGQP